LAALTVGVAGWLWARRVLDSNFLAAEVSSTSSKGGKRYPSSLLPLDLAAPGFLVYGGAVTWFLLSGMLADASLEPQQFATAFVLIIGAWFALVRLPLASLSELALGSRASAILGTFHGLLLG
ncbi:unnamed protein product, partial [Phaeothamnion confervicola]